jgi:protocatechuate 3,4-dioxygenase beta subunit
MKNNDNLWSRRQFVLSSAISLAAFRVATEEPVCTLVAEQEEGPYYINAALVRQDIRERKVGVPLQLRVAVVDAKRCSPLPDAALDIWHCDATGVYSGFTGNGGGFDGPMRGRGPAPGGSPGNRGRGGGPPSARVTDATRFLRGIQVSNRDGVAQFQTLYPGWYAGRTIHIHIKVHLGGEMAGQTYSGGHVCHTGQSFFPEDITTQIAKLDPYTSHSTIHRTLQTEDHVFLSQGGSHSVLTLERQSKRSDSDRFVATVTVAVDPDSTPRRI